MADELVLFMYQSWANLDQAVAGLTQDEAESRYPGCSSIAWTVAHATHMVDSWINTRMQGLAPHPLLSTDDFRTGGSGKAEDWPAITRGVREVRQAARRFLDSDPRPDLERRVRYDGSIAFLRPIGLSLRYAVMRIAAHHFMHAGEIEVVRSLMGHAVEGQQVWGRDLA